jgi:membrane protein DedA with SNARE-associated domain
MDNKKREETRFFVRNLLRGLIWLSILVGGYIIFKKTVDFDYMSWLKPIWENPFLVYGIFTISEVVIGIIPPEIFMIISAEKNIVSEYITSVAILSVISYGAGFAGYWIGIYFNHTKYYRYLKRKYFGKYEKYLNKFGMFLVIVASLTPLPFSGIAMLVGSVKYPMKKYLLFSLFRFLRFVVYSYIIWQAHSF